MKTPIRRGGSPRWNTGKERFTKQQLQMRNQPVAVPVMIGDVQPNNPEEIYIRWLEMVKNPLRLKRFKSYVKKMTPVDRLGLYNYGPIAIMAKRVDKRLLSQDMKELYILVQYLESLIHEDNEEAMWQGADRVTW